ncbi:MAG: glutamine synthetase [Solirubrobacteraceae bacterium]|nr:glutamine synthetase [Solirubrobacteraceae bacterium]
MSALDDTLNESSRDAMLRDIDARIREYDVKHVYLQYVSVPGRVMGKAIPARHFERIAHSGLAWTYLSAGGFTVDVHGDLIGPSAAAVAEGLLIPDLGTFEVLPWDTDVARVFCGHFHRPDDEHRPGAIVLGDCRANLKRVHADFTAELGAELRSGCEPEMSWFPDRGTISASISKLPAHVGTAYHIGHIEEMRPILKRVTRYGQAMGLDMIQADYEDPGQIEMNFAFGDCLTTADRLTTYRQICMQVAKEFGVLATFMPKPVPGIMANGCHHHLSLWRGDEPAFADPRGTGINDLARRAIGGLLDHARGMSAIVAPTVNSYARYWDVGQYAPSAPVWGNDDRQCIVRVLGNRMEYRAPDASCNPYLTHAVLLAAMRDGIAREIDPGPPNPAETVVDPADARFPLLPRTLGEALDALAEDPVVRAALPGEIHDTFVAIKQDEWHRACGAVTEWHREMYLDHIP